MNKLRIFLVVTALAAAAAGFAYWWAAKQPSQNSPLVLQGNVEIRQVNLAFKVDGRIVELDADEGDWIKPGQRLASLEKVYFQDALAQVRAQHDQAKADVAKMEAGYRSEEIAQARAVAAEREATLVNAKATLDRAKQLLTTAAGSRRTYDEALAAEGEAAARLNSARHSLALLEAGYRKEDIDAAKARLAEKEAVVRDYERRLADADLIAPNTGVILSRVHEKGAIVRAGETIYVLSLTSPVWVRTYVSEPELGRIRPGQEVTIRTDTPGSQSLSGRIGFISPTAEFTPKTVETRELRTALVYRLRIVVDDEHNLLRQGMPVTIIVPMPGIAP
jgi:HlyD family secretion protein